MMMLYAFLAITKDFKDIEGDKKHKKHTFVIRVGHERAIQVALVSTLIFYPLTMYFFYNIFDKISMVVLMSLTFIASLYEIGLAVENGERVFTRIRIFFLSLIIILIVYSTGWI